MIDYDSIAEQIGALAEDESNIVGLMANTAAILHELSGWLWVGFYIVEGGKLKLGPFQGPPACMTIPYGRGVCGTSWERGETIIVADVEQFPGHIACSSLSRSEIVVPLRNRDGEIWGVLDIDSDRTDTFTEDDAEGLQKVTSRLVPNPLKSQNGNKTTLSS